MKGYRLIGVGDLRYEDCPQPHLDANSALVKVRASGICSSDIPRIFVKGTYHFPTIPGHEFSGIVVAVGDALNNNLIGKKVCVFPLIPCKKCELCKNKHYEMCENYNYLGSRSDGGFAEYVAVPVWNLVELPESIGFDEGAMFEPLAVALHCLHQGKVSEKDSLAIIGTGAIAFAIGQWAKAYNIQDVVIVGRNEEKKKIASRLGLQFITQNELKDRLFDVTVEAVGTSEALETAIQHVSANGRVVVMGNPYSDIKLSQNTYWRILRKQLCLIGTWNSMYDGINLSEWMEVRRAVEKKEINAKALISHYYSQEDLIKGLNIMREHVEPYSKIMVLWGEDE